MGPAGWVRLAGKGCLASGFILSLYGLTAENPLLVRISLSLLAAGVLSMCLVLLLRVRSRGAGKDAPPGEG